MKIDDLTIGEAKKLASMFGCLGGKDVDDECFYEIGKNYFIRTVTHHYVGKLVAMNRKGCELIFEDMSWIPDDGRFHNMLRSGDFKEVEPYLDGMMVNINRDTIIDSILWDKKIPRSQK